MQMQARTPVSRPRVAPSAAASFFASADDAEEADFAAMRADYRAHGGLAGGDDLAYLLEDCGRGSFASLARKVVAGEVFGFEWRRTFWIPMFQFTEDLDVKPGLKAVLAELASEYDGRRLAEWFVEPNGWLEERRPIDVLDANPQDVLQAARADRFVATG